MDPSTLDINQSVELCESQGLLDALVHVYTQALHDYVTPMERIMHTPKVYTYLELILVGRAYPSGECLSHKEALDARASVYRYLLPHLASFDDPEALLHALDFAFEDPYLDEAEIGRQAIIDQLLASSLDPSVLYLFVARNTPKYPQYIHLPAAVLHDIVVALASDQDPTTREDRQLATEYLLSIYTPPAEMYELFSEAAFYRILRAYYRSEHRWSSLLEILVRDPIDLFATLSSIMPQAANYLESILPDLLRNSAGETAVFIDEHAPDLHSSAVSMLSEEKQVEYLRSALEKPTPHIDTSLRHRYATLLADTSHDQVLHYLDSRGPQFFDLPKLWSDFQEIHYVEGEIWALDRQGNKHSAFATINQELRARGANVVGLASITRLGTRLCHEHAADTDIEDRWYDILHELIEVVELHPALELRELISETLGSLVSASVSFPRLFKRLVDSSAKSAQVFSELRSILTGMLESYRADGEMLRMSTRLVQADLFVVVQELLEKRQRGWTAGTLQCGECGKNVTGGGDVVLQASGLPIHVLC